MSSSSALAFVVIACMATSHASAAPADGRTAGNDGVTSSTLSLIHI